MRQQLPEAQWRDAAPGFLADHGLLLARLGSALGFLALWWGIAAWAGDRALPDPPAVLRAAAEVMADGSLPRALGATLARVLGAFLLAMLAGSALGILMGRSRMADAAGDFWLVLLLNLPALVVILLAYIWFGQTEAATVVAVALVKLPGVAVALREGARALDPGFEEMARVYRFGTVARWRDVVLPQLQPYLAAAARAGLATAWKIVLVAELLGRPSGVGFEMNLRFQVFDVAGLLAYALTFAAVMLLIEGGLMRPAERRARAWRGLA
ncbi:ABC transporter permease [Pseudoroseomonas ludipueritiae]|uniref:ABC transporter permease subunit n=1 Tax=Pseudoroseomonas ludipueritiae TaxID=198093 RepID=A0ABR7RAM8_9PROT|nr:ABC transporter permease subunit [Pseudoroseomonas ludipueritiae]MBC9178882.1 ABC transporter permease subunit [Pseudoroseomonas ludipueritiae]